MHFCVQYDTATGIIQGTVHTATPPGPMPEGRGQIVFEDEDNIETEGKVVDLATLTLIPATE